MYTGRLPLALEVLGSFLLGRSVGEWEDELEKLHKIPHKEIHEILHLSFKSLDHYTKKIFLDIACFFLDMDKEYVIRILRGCDFFPDIGFSVLIQRSLLTIDLHNKLRMHDLIRDMGREIVRKKSPNNLGRRSRLWFHEDVLKILSKHLGSEAVEGLTLTFPIPKGVHLKTKAFAKLKNLRLLEINDAPLTGSYKHLSKELKWLCWHKCPLEFLPPNLHLDNLVVLDMQHSNLKQLWKENRILNNLKILNLSYSKNLTKSPCFLHFPHLEILTLEGCTSLVELHESIEHLKRLVELNLQECKNLRNIPRTISALKSLESINLCGCLKLDRKAWNMTAFNGLSQCEPSL
ncbi:TMV resistance protein N [Morella rubra]|uniref:TMV resistance protein N n=1 Tax=Morella rubra TaxID=262757 RepID=A0A6A1WUK7_9ROSI|nr:TMV resistance protein N [Morella rubra]